MPQSRWKFPWSSAATTDRKASQVRFKEVIVSEVMFCESGIYMRLVMGTGCPTNGPLRVEMTVERGKPDLSIFYRIVQ